MSSATIDNNERQIWTEIVNERAYLKRVPAANRPSIVDAVLACLEFVHRQAAPGTADMDHIKHSLMRIVLGDGADEDDLDSAVPLEAPDVWHASVLQQLCDFRIPDKVNNLAEYEAHQSRQTLVKK